MHMVWVGCVFLQFTWTLTIQCGSLHVRAIKLPPHALYVTYTKRTKPGSVQHPHGPFTFTLLLRSVLAEHYIYCYCAANFVWHAINKQINWALNCLDAVYSLPRNCFSAKATEYFFFQLLLLLLMGYCGGSRNNTINAAQNLLNWIVG